MRKRYNYFDDDFDEQGNIKIQQNPWTELKDKLVATIKNLDFDTVLRLFKRVASTIGIIILLSCKKIASLFNGKSEKKKNPALIGILSLVFLIVLMTVIIVTSVMTMAGKANSRQEKFNQAAYAVCYDYIERFGTANYKFMNSEYEVKGCMLTGLCVAREIDFNNDSKSELLLIYNDNDYYFADVWGFDNKEFKQIYSRKLPFANNRNDDIFFTIYYDNNEYFIAEHNESDIQDVTILRLASSEFKKKASAQYNTSEMGYYMHKRNVTDSFECIRVAVLRENTAANTVERTLDEIDRFSSSDKDTSQHITASGVSLENAMNSAYFSLIEEYNKKYGVAELVNYTDKPHIGGLASVKLVDFNGDSTDELMLIYHRSVSKRKEDRNGNYIAIEEYRYFCDIYTFNGKNARLVYQNEGLSNKLDSPDTTYYVIKKDGDRNLLCTNTFNISEYGRVVKATSKIMAFDGEKFDLEQKAVYEKSYGYSQYYLNSKNVSRSTFMQNGGFDVPFFDGESSYDKDVWEIGLLQGENDDEDSVKSQISLTEEEIKKLNPLYNPRQM